MVIYYNFSAVQLPVNVSRTAFCMISKRSITVQKIPCVLFLFLLFACVSNMLSAVLFFLCIVAIVLQVIALCGNIGSSLRSVYYVRVDTRLASSFLDDIRHNLLKIPDYLTFAAFVICQGFTTGSSSSSIICTQPSLGYRYGKFHLPSFSVPETDPAIIKMLMGFWVCSSALFPTDYTTRFR